MSDKEEEVSYNSVEDEDDDNEELSYNSGDEEEYETHEDYDRNIKYEHIKENEDVLDTLLGAEEKHIKSLLYQESRSKIIDRRISISPPSDLSHYWSWPLRNKLKKKKYVSVDYLDGNKKIQALSGTFMIEPGYVDQDHSISFVALATNPLREYRIKHNGLHSRISVINRLKSNDKNYLANCSWRVVPPSEVAIELGLEEHLPPHEDMDPTLVCFQAVGLGAYIRQSGNELYLKPRQSSMRFIESVTFRLMAPLRK